ncbi:MAG: glycosyltransferase family 39 protein, partial [Candidatus Omnitrophota bacterium]
MPNALALMPRFLRYLLLGMALWFVAVYFLLVYFRMQYPFSMEWQEGFGVDVVIRIFSGEKLYVRPSIEFISCIYTPLYFYLSALVSKIIGVGFVPLRLIAFLSSLGCFFLIYRFVKKETRSPFAGILALCQFAATYKLTGWWFDCGRADSLFLLFLLAALYGIRFHASKIGWSISAILMAFSFLTKQTALIVAVPVMFYCFLAERRSCLYFIVPFSGIVAGSTFILNYLHDGWYWYYIFDLPAQQGVVESVLHTFWTKDLFSRLPLPSLVAVFYLFFSVKVFSKERSLFYLLSAFGM